MVWWKAVSNTPTIGTPGISSWHTRIPIKFAGLWSGASSLHSSTFANTSSFNTTDWANFSPPCTTRCPTASISERLFTAPVFGFTSASSTIWIPSLWVGIGASVISLSWPASWYTNLPSIPILSQSPLASTASVSELISWYFKEELPQLITNTFICFLLTAIFLRFIVTNPHMYV